LTSTAATPVYLHADNTENYNIGDSVSQNFTVGLENNVQWQTLYNNVLLQGNNAILQHIGYETLTATLDNYSKSVSIIIKPISLGINDVLSDNNLVIYPNPVTDKLIIENGELKINNVEIFDIAGKKLSTIDYQLPTINVSVLPAGIYFVKITTDKGVLTNKFIKE
jgi:hypothetical protein